MAETAQIKEIIGVRSFVLITGASRGFGRALAVELGRVVGAGSTLMLVARSRENLENTKAIVRDVRPGLAVECEALDLATADRDAFERAVRANYGSADHEVAIVIHNAGTIGQDGRKLTVRSHYNVTICHRTVIQAEMQLFQMGNTAQYCVCK